MLGAVESGTMGERERQRVAREHGGTRNGLDERSQWKGSLYSSILNFKGHKEGWTTESEKELGLF